MSDVPRSYGSGRRVITPDGCAVDFYAMMPGFGEPDIEYVAGDHRWLRAVPVPPG